MTHILFDVLIYCYYCCLLDDNVGTEIRFMNNITINSQCFYRDGSAQVPFQLQGQVILMLPCLCILMQSDSGNHLPRNSVAECIRDGNKSDVLIGGVGGSDVELRIPKSPIFFLL